MEFAAANFMPIPLFNFVHHSNPQLRRAAKHELIQMYSRLPVRNDIKFTHKRYMYPLFDALSDSNRYNKEVAQEILDNTIKNHPEKILPHIVQVMKSGNCDAKLNLGVILRKHPDYIIRLPSENIMHLFTHPNYLLKRLGADLLLCLPKQPSFLSKEAVIRGISDSDYEYQGKCMEIATKYGLLKDLTLLLHKVKGSKSHLQQVAIQSFVGLINRDDFELTDNDINNIIKELDSPNTSSREAAILSVSRLSDLKKFKIPFEPFISGIKSQIQTVRDASERILREILPNMKKNDVSKMFNTFITLSESADEETIHHILPLIASSWKHYPQKVMSILTKFLSSSNKKIQKAVEHALCEIAREDSKGVLNALLPIQEERTFLTKSVLQKALHKIGSENPDSIKLLENFVTQTNITVKKNALTAMEGLSEEYAHFFDKPLLIEQIKTESFAEIRLKLLSVLSNVIQNSTTIEEHIVNDIFPLLECEDRDLRKRACKLFEEIAKIDSSLISMDVIQKLSKDENPSIRESSAKIVRYFVSTQTEPSIELLNKLIDDEKWIVQSAVIDTLMRSDWELESELIEKIIGMIDQPDEWLSRKVLEFIQFVGKKHPEQIPISKIHDLSSHPNPHIRSMVLKIIELLSFEVAWELLLKLMQDDDLQVRDQAARSLVSVSKDMTISNLFSHTLKYFSDETDIILQRSIANALQRIVKYESAEIKNRLIGILKIRCQLSQDPVLCQIWHELDEK
jgi:HEAT repeat protein